MNFNSIDKENYSRNSLVSILTSDINENSSNIITDNKFNINNRNIKLMNQSNQSNDNPPHPEERNFGSVKSVHMEHHRDDQPKEAGGGNLSKYFRIEKCRFNRHIYINAAILLKKFKKDAVKHAPPPDLSHLKITEAHHETKELQPHSVDVSKVDSITKDTSVFRDEDESELPSQDQEEKESESKDETKINSRRTSGVESVESRKTSIHAHKHAKQKIKYKSLKEKKLTYELALNTLKFEGIFEKILEECGFFIQFPDFREEDQIVLVIFFDYVKRKFQKRTVLENEDNGEEGNVAFAVAEDIEQSIYAMRTKLNASVMRLRVRNGVRSLNQMLPEQYRIGEEFAEKMLVYLWCNTNIASNADIVHILSEYGFKRVSSAKTLEHFEFYQDRHCSDLYVFHHDDRDFLQECDMVVKKKFAVVQDKSTSLAIHCFIANLVQGEEIAIVNPTTLLTAIHVEGLLKNKFGSVVPLAPIRVFRNFKDDDDTKIFQKMGSNSLKIHTEDIMTLDSTNEKYRFIKHAFFQAKCTRSGIVSPIDFLDTEQDDITLLKDYALRATLDGAKPTKISDSIVRNSMILRQCFRFSSVRSVTYLTHSVYEEENELLMNKTVDLINKNLMKDTLENNGKYDAFANVPPNLPMLVDDLTEHGILNEKNIRYPPSAETNGFFVGIHAKEYKYMSLENPEIAHEEKSKKKKKKGKDHKESLDIQDNKETQDQKDSQDQKDAQDQIESQDLKKSQD